MGDQRRTSYGTLSSAADEAAFARRAGSRGRTRRGVHLVRGTAGLGSEFLRAVRAAFALIRRNPEQFPRVRGDIRRALVRRFPYAVYYVVEPDHVSVFAVIHTRQHPRRWQSRR